MTEGYTGTSSANFTVTLSTAASQPVTVAYHTSNGTATAGSDYQSASGPVTFAAGETSKTISVLVNGDRAGEANETFSVNLSPVDRNAVLTDGQVTGTRVDDEPRVSINGVSKNDGNNGTTSFVFTVTLSAASAVCGECELRHRGLRCRGARRLRGQIWIARLRAGHDQQDDHHQRERLPHARVGGSILRQTCQAQPVR